MKKIISFIAIFAIMIQSFTFTVNAESASEAKQFLVDLGIINSYDYAEGEELTRASFAKLAAHVLNPKEGYASYISGKFGDVPTTREDAGEIYYLDSMGVMIGRGDGLFHPEDAMLVRDAVKVAVTMLNYGTHAENRGGYWGGYTAMGAELGLVDGLNADNDATITAEQAFILFANTLDTEPIQQIMGGDGIKFMTVKDETLLYTAFDVVKGKGTVTANEKTSLEIESSVGENIVVIDGITFNAGTTDISDKLGFYVEYYAYTPDNGEDGIIVSYRVLENRNEVLVIEADKILEATTENKIVYEDRNRQYDADIAPGADVIYNGVAKQGHDRWMIMPDSGKVILIDSDKDDKYDIIQVESYINYVLTATPQSGYIIDKYGQTAIDTKAKNWEMIKITYLDSQVQLADLKEWDVLSIKADAEVVDENGYRSIDFDNAKYLDIQVSRNELTGRAESINKTENTVTLGLREYYYSENLIKASKNENIGFSLPKVGDEIGIIIDINGMAAAVKFGGFGNETQGFVIKRTIDEDSEPASVKLRMFTGGEGLKIYSCKEKITVDGKNGYAEELTKKLINKPQLISFRLNADGFITEIDTSDFDSAEENEETSLQLDGSYAEARFKSTQKNFHTRGTYEIFEFYVSGATKIFKVPAVEDILRGDYVDDDFQLITTSEFKDNHVYEMDIYNKSDVGLPEFAVYYAPNSVDETIDGRSGTIIMVNDIWEGLDKNGELTTFITGLNRGNEIQYSFRRQEIADKFEFSKGDLISVKYNSDNQILNFGKILDYSPDMANTHVYGGGIESAPRHIGTAYAKGANALVLKIDAEKAGTTKDLYNICNVASNIKVLLYDAVENEVSVIGLGDILCEKEVGEESAYLLYAYVNMNGQTNDLYAYKLK